MAINSSELININEDKNLNKNNKIQVFGENLFNGSFIKRNKITRFDQNYNININDVINIKMWGMINQELSVIVDDKFNIFLPKIGTINLYNVKYLNLEKIIKKKLYTLYKGNVKIYVSIKNIQAINIYVSGNVNKPGMYDGFSTDSIINFLDKAKGIETNVGSYRYIDIIRNNKVIQEYDLYDFLLNGKLQTFLFKNGDIIFVKEIKKTITVKGEVFKPFRFEIKNENLKFILNKMAKIKNNATNVIINKNNSLMNQHKKIYNIKDLNLINIENNDEIIIKSNHFTNNIKIHIQGEHEYLKEIFVKKGTNLKELINQIKISTQSNIDNLQIFRKSVASLQKKLIDAHLKELEILITTQSANTVNEGIILKNERQSIIDFINKAKLVQPKGQIIIDKLSNIEDIILENDDIINIPHKNNLIIVEGEVSFPGAHTYVENKNVEYYIDKTGGFTNKANTDRILLIHQNGNVEKLSDGWFVSKGLDYPINKTDSLLILPKVEMKKLQITKDITEVIYQIALSAGVLLSI
jgi:protein involved in polysaccharide export with SLBB domain